MIIGGKIMSRKACERKTKKSLLRQVKNKNIEINKTVIMNIIVLLF